MSLAFFFSSSFSLSLWLTKYPSLYGSCCRHGTALVTANTLKNMWPSLLLLEWGGRTAAWYASRASVKRKLELHDDGNTVCYYKLKFSKDRRTKKVARLVVYHFFLFFPLFLNFKNPATIPQKMMENKKATVGRHPGYLVMMKRRRLSCCFLFFFFLSGQMWRFNDAISVAACALVDRIRSAPSLSND